MEQQKGNINRSPILEETLESDTETAQRLQLFIQAITRIEGNKYFLFEYFTKEIICPEGPTTSFCGTELKEIGNAGWTFYTQNVPGSELQKILDICHMEEKHIVAHIQSSVMDYAVTFDLHFCKNHQKKLVNHKIFPLLMTSDNRLWMVCTLSPTPQKEFGHIELHNVKDNRQWEYAFDTNQWNEKCPAKLNQTEIGILYCAAQDYTIAETAEAIHKSIDAIKSARKNLFKKLNVKSMIGAVQWARNHKYI